MQKKAVLLLNLGSPDSCSVGDVRRYLREFLMDERVLDAPWPIRAMVVYFFILPFRPKQSAHAYSKVWTPEGSPLMVISKKQQALLQQMVDVSVFLAMRYGSPSIPDTIRKIHREEITDLFIVPLYPHYAMSSYETVVERVNVEIEKQGVSPKITILQPFYDEEDYIKALIECARPYLEGGFDKLLFSFHGVPERHLRKSDPTHAHCLATPDCCQRPHPAHDTCYRHQCFQTVDKFISMTGIAEDKYAVSFQSRLGRDPWLKPYTDFELKRFAREGVKKILVMCPAFLSDCLETLEEIAIQGKETFIKAGGESLTLIPCLNDHPEFIQFLKRKVNGWLQDGIPEKRE